MKSHDSRHTGSRFAVRHCRRIASLLFLVLISTGCSDSEPPPPAADEAKQRADVENVSVDAAAQYFTYRNKADVADYFKGMDSLSVPTIDATHPDQLLDQLPNPNDRPPTTVEDPGLTSAERIGRNTWMAWCGGNEGFWDWLGTDSLGFVDLLKLVDSRTRSTRFRDAGMINEPGMEESGAPSKDAFGLWLDVPADPRVREWRKTYLSQTFKQILAGQHKSQIGLKKGDEYGPNPLRDLYTGKSDAFKGHGYLYPSEYFSNETRQPYDNDYAGDGYGNSEYGSGGGQQKYDNDLDRTIPPPDMYGISSGVVGLRLFPNPYFDEEAKENWNAERYYTDKSYWTDPDLVRPFRVGMACAFCHASFHPLQPPRDVHEPEWENISGSIGAQYLRMRATVGNLLEPDNFVYHLLDSEPPGTVDTSLVASDNVNNPNTMNAVFMLRERAILSLFNPREELSTDSAMLPSLWGNLTPEPPEDKPGYEDAAGTEDPADGNKADDGYAANEGDDASYGDKADSSGAGVPCPLDYATDDHIPQAIVDLLVERGLLDAALRSNCPERGVPRILLDGADSIGTWGALARVFLNIGTYWEQWNQIHQVVLGFTPQQPFTIRDCETNSVYWNATSYRVPGLRDYFLKVTPPMPLLSTDSGMKRLQPVDADAVRREATRSGRDFNELLSERRRYHVDVSKLARGRAVFAKNCLVCHSSIQPESMLQMAGMEELQDLLKRFDELAKERRKVRAAAEENGEFWEHNPAQWLGNTDYIDWAMEVVEKNEFWQWNYLSTDYRIPINVVQTNSARAMGTNGMTGHMWQDFASDSYRNLPSVGAIDYFNPYAGEEGEYQQFTPRHRVAKGVPEGGGGPGFYRVPTLVSIWATAPFLHNNSLGLFNNDPSVNGRLDAYDDAIRKLLWPEKRLESSSYNGATAERLQQDHGLIWRTPHESYLTLDAKRVPHQASQLSFIAELQKYKPLRWLHFVNPMWLASAILLVGALIILKISHHPKRRTYAYLILFAAALLYVLHWLARRFPDVPVLSWLNAIYPVALPIVALVIIAVILWLPLSRKWTRRFGYVAVVLSLLIGLIVYFNAGQLGDVRIGPIPAGTPVNLLANFNSEADRSTQFKSVATVIDGLAEINSRHLSPEETERVLKQQIAPALMEVNKCPDFVMDHGHYFPWFDSMSNDDKEALIELLKTF